MFNLDDVSLISTQDPHGIIEATKLLYKQCQQAWDDIQSLSLPQEFQNPSVAVIAGMGGSHLGAQIINSVYHHSLTVPLIIQNDYHLPGYIGKNSLVIATSYSGNTEETISFVHQARKVGARIVCISTGGELEAIALEANLPHFIINSQHNPSKIPRYGAGYLFIAQMAILAKTGVINFTSEELNQIITTLQSQNNRFSPQVPTVKNLAKQFALNTSKECIILAASEHLVGSAYILKNQINETAKHFAALFPIPELNHHLLEALENPPSNIKNLHFVFINSGLYHPRIQARYDITREVVQKIGHPITDFQPQSNTILEQAFETIAFGSYAAIYLSLINHKLSGEPNPWVDYLKTELEKR
jgi:glucose/mannose-6-phosphate isomerase